MVVHKSFQKNYREGGIEVQVNFNVENNEKVISCIHIHSTFNSGLPATPTLDRYSNKAILVAHYIDENGQNIMERIIGNSYADDIVNEILELESSL